MIWLALLAGIAVAQTTPAGLPKEVVQLSRIKKQAAADLRRIPAFTCLASYERFRQEKPTAPLLQADTLRADVLYSDHRERFGWPGSGKMEASLGELTGTGLSSDGEFLGFATTIFVHDNSRASFAGIETLQGRKALRYDYIVPLMLSGYTLNFRGNRATVGMKGSFWADSETLQIMRLRVEADGIPAALGVQSIITEIDYAKTRLGSQPPVLFPQNASVTTAETNGTSRNFAHYTHCREFLTTSEISFDDPAEVSSKPATSLAALPPLQVGTRLRLALQTDLPANAALGDLFRTTVAGGPFAGAILTGRIRLLERLGGNVVLGMEMMELERSGRKERFFAALSRLDPKVGAVLIQGKSMGSNTTLPDLPGVGYLEFRNAEAILFPAGSWLEWQVVPISKPQR